MIQVTDPKPERGRYRRYDRDVDDDNGDIAHPQADVGTGAPTRLSEALERLVRTMGAPPISVLTQLESRWPDIVGPALATSTRPIELVDGVLVVGCDDAGWASQISWMEGQIKQRFDDLFGAKSGSDLGVGLLQRVKVRVDR